MICLCMTNLGDVDAKNSPSVMVAKCHILNYHVLVDINSVNVCNNLIGTCGSFAAILCKIFVILY